MSHYLVAFKSVLRIYLREAIIEAWGDFSAFGDWRDWLLSEIRKERERSKVGRYFSGDLEV
jgi:hypothetical protein